MSFSDWLLALIDRSPVYKPMLAELLLETKDIEEEK